MHHGSVSPEIAQGLLALQKRIAAAKIPPSKLDETINVAVWNVREFGKARRTEAALHFIAEVVGQFDLVALVELRDDLSGLGGVRVAKSESAVPGRASGASQAGKPVSLHRTPQSRRAAG